MLWAEPMRRTDWTSSCKIGSLCSDMNETIDEAHSCRSIVKKFSFGCLLNTCNLIFVVIQIFSPKNHIYDFSSGIKFLVIINKLFYSLLVPYIVCKVNVTRCIFKLF